MIDVPVIHLVSLSTCLVDDLDLLPPHCELGALPLALALAFPLSEALLAGSCVQGQLSGLLQ